jgi:hypothetical protein
MPPVPATRLFHRRRRSSRRGLPAGSLPSSRARPAWPGAATPRLRGRRVSRRNPAALPAGCAAGLSSSPANGVGRGESRAVAELAHRPLPIAGPLRRSSTDRRLGGLTEPGTGVAGSGSAGLSFALRFPLWHRRHLLCSVYQRGPTHIRPGNDPAGIRFNETSVRSAACRRGCATGLARFLQKVLLPA